MIKYNSRPGVEVLFVEVPDGARRFVYNGIFLQYWKPAALSGIKIDAKGFEIFPTTDLITEDEMKEVCEKTTMVLVGSYKDYISAITECGGFIGPNAGKSSFKSLLIHLKLDPEKRYLVLINKL